jgi:hypothetical protein
MVLASLTISSEPGAVVDGRGDLGSHADGRVLVVRDEDLDLVVDVETGQILNRHARKTRCAQAKKIGDFGPHAEKPSDRLFFGWRGESIPGR